MNIAKQYEEEQVCLYEKQDRFCIVDDILIFLYQKPSHYCKLMLIKNLNTVYTFKLFINQITRY